jgi:hypothetical protein
MSPRAKRGVSTHNALQTNCVALFYCLKKIFDSTVLISLKILKVSLSLNGEVMHEKKIVERTDFYRGGQRCRREKGLRIL